MLTRRGVSFAYPANWGVIDDRDEDMLIGSTPTNGLRGSGIVHDPVPNEGIEFGSYDANARDLRGAAYELLGRFRLRYPFLKYVELDCRSQKHPRH